MRYDLGFQYNQLNVDDPLVDFADEAAHMVTVERRGKVLKATVSLLQMTLLDCACFKSQL